MGRAATFRNNVDISGILDVSHNIVTHNNLEVKGNTKLLGFIESDVDISGNLDISGNTTFSGSVLSKNSPFVSQFGFAQMYLDNTYEGQNNNLTQIRVPFNNTLGLINDPKYYDVSYPQATVLKTNKGIKILHTGIYKVSYSILLANENKVINTDRDSNINWKIIITETKNNETTELSMGTSYAFTKSTRFFYLNNGSANFTGLMKLNKDCYYNIEVNVYVGYF